MGARWEVAFREHWTEPQPVPLELSSDEVLAWFEEYVDQAVYVKATPRISGGWVLYVDGISATKGESMRDAVCMAAAKFNEANE